MQGRSWSSHATSSMAAIWESHFSAFLFTLIVTLNSIQFGFSPKTPSSLSHPLSAGKKQGRERRQRLWGYRLATHPKLR